MDTQTLLLIGTVLTALAVVLLIVLLLRRPERALDHAQLERALREEQREGRGELRCQLADSIQRTDSRLDELRAALTDDAHKARLELASGQQQFAESLSLQLRELTARNEQRIGEMRQTLESQLKALQSGNEQKLEQMRATVDEKLQATLEA